MEQRSFSYREFYTVRVMLAEEGVFRGMSNGEPLICQRYSVRVSVYDESGKECGSTEEKFLRKAAAKSMYEDYNVADCRDMLSNQGTLDEPSFCAIDAITFKSPSREAVLKAIEKQDESQHVRRDTYFLTGNITTNGMVSPIVFDSHRRYSQKDSFIDGEFYPAAEKQFNYWLAGAKGADHSLLSRVGPVLVRNASTLSYNQFADQRSNPNVHIIFADILSDRVIPIFHDGYGYVMAQIKQGGNSGWVWDLTVAMEGEVEGLRWTPQNNDSNGRGFSASDGRILARLETYYHGRERELTDVVVNRPESGTMFAVGPTRALENAVLDIERRAPSLEVGQLDLVLAEHKFSPLRKA